MSTVRRVVKDRRTAKLQTRQGCCSVADWQPRSSPKQHTHKIDRLHLFQPAWLMRWYIVTVVLSTDVQKERIAKLQTKQTVAVLPPVPLPRDGPMWRLLRRGGTLNMGNIRSKRERDREV